MRILLTLLLITGICTCVRAQVGGNVDAEYASWCMVDSVGPSTSTRFTRLINVATLQVIDIDPQTGSLYAPTGTLIPCETVDIPVIPAAQVPGGDLYADCQCTYVISQEGHKVKELFGGTRQLYDVEFQEVVTRQCSGSAVATEISRETRIGNGTFSTLDRVRYTVPFANNGDYIDDLNFRIYPTVGSGYVVTVDLNPATVQASYPSLTLNTSDFTYDGSNLAAMAAAYAIVLAEALPATQNQVSTGVLGSGISISAQYLHEPSSDYAVLPWNGDADLLVSGPVQNNGPLNILGIANGLSTLTQTFTEYCPTGIYTQELGVYYSYDPTNPLAIAPRLNVSTNLQEQQSSPTTFCDAPPEVCAELATSNVVIAGCLEICDTVDVRVVPSTDTIPVQVVALPIDTCGAKKNGHQRLTGTSDTYAADTYNSVSLTVVSGTISVTIDGVAVEYPSGFSNRWAAPDPCDRLSESFLIDAANGSVIIASLQ